MDLTRQLRGKEIAEVMTNGHVVSIRTQDGSEVVVRWVNDNGETIKGHPVVQSRGFRMRLERFRDLIRLPAAGA